MTQPSRRSNGIPAALALLAACAIENELHAGAVGAGDSATPQAPPVEDADPTDEAAPAEPGECPLGPEPGRCVCENAYQGCLASGAAIEMCEEDFALCVADSEWPDDVHPSASGTTE